MIHEPLRIVAEDTPNPLSNKFNLNRTLLNGSGRDFPNRELAERSALATELYQIPGVTGVFIGQSFVTVTVQPGNSWWAMRPLVEQTLESFIQRGEPAVASGPAPVAETAVESRMFGDTELAIARILEEEIRPAVAMDGGDVTLVAYEDSIVKLRLRGACHQCPSSTVTLKLGIENRLKQSFPEIKAVEAV